MSPVKIKKFELFIEKNFSFLIKTKPKIMTLILSKRHFKLTRKKQASFLMI